MGHALCVEACRDKCGRPLPYRLTVYLPRNKWYDGTLKSLEDRSHCPHNNPNQYKPKEIKLIQDLRRRNSNAGKVKRSHRKDNEEFYASHKFFSFLDF